MGYKANDAARETRVKKAYVKAAWHNARNDAGKKRGGRPRKAYVQYDPKKHGPHERT